MVQSYPSALGKIQTFWGAQMSGDLAPLNPLVSAGPFMSLLWRAVAADTRAPAPPPERRLGLVEAIGRLALASSPNHWITSVASANTVAGISRPRALAVFMLSTVSNFTGACTGRSAGLSPLRMRSTYPAACRYCSV